MYVKRVLHPNLLPSPLALVAAEVLSPFPTPMHSQSTSTLYRANSSVLLSFWWNVRPLHAQFSDGTGPPHSLVNEHLLLGSSRARSSLCCLVSSSMCPLACCASLSLSLAPDSSKFWVPAASLLYCCVASDFKVPISCQDASPKCQKQSMWFHFLHSPPRYQRLMCSCPVLCVHCPPSCYHFLPAQRLLFFPSPFHQIASGGELVHGIGGGSASSGVCAIPHPCSIQSIALDHKNSCTPATWGNLRVLKKNFFKHRFIAALCSWPNSKSFWHVMNIGHLITARLDVFYLLSCAVRPPCINIFQSSGSINFEWALSRKMTWVFSSTKLLLKAFCFVIITMYLQIVGMTRVIGVKRQVFPLLVSPIRHITFSLCSLMQ